MKRVIITGWEYTERNWQNAQPEMLILRPVLAFL